MNKLYEEEDIRAIANAIRSKNGSSDTYTVAQMDDAIRNLPSGIPVGTKCAYASTDSIVDLVTEINKISSSYINMDYMFYMDNIITFGTAFPVNIINNWDVSNVTSMKYMWNRINFMGLDLSGWDVSNVTDMEGTFAGLGNYDFTTLGISSWDVSSVTNMKGMFKGFNTIASIDLSSWNVSNVDNMYDMFNGDTNITSLNLSGWDISSVTNMGYMFQRCTSLQHLDIRSMDFSNVTSYSNIFGSGASGVPSNCEIIVKDQTAKDWVLARRSDFTNVVIAQ